MTPDLDCLRLWSFDRCISSYRICD